MAKGDNLKGPDGLTTKQRKFVNAYIETNSVTESAIRAGYAKSSASAAGSRLLATDKIQQAIDARLTKVEEQTDLSVAWVLNRLKEEAIECGENSSHGARVRALELLGKHRGIFIDRREVSGKGGGPIRHEVEANVSLVEQMRELSTEELAEIVEADEQGDGNDE